MSSWRLEREGRTEGRPVVLLAEDDPELRRLFAEALRASCDLLECDDGIAILEALGRSRQGRLPYPDLLITDERLPNLGGLDTLSEVREYDPFLPAILVTGYADPRTRAEAGRLGAMAVLQKPVSPEFLCDQVRLILACFAEEGRWEERHLAACARRGS